MWSGRLRKGRGQWTTKKQQGRRWTLQLHWPFSVISREQILTVLRPRAWAEPTVKWMHSGDRSALELGVRNEQCRLHSLYGTHPYPTANECLCVATGVHSQCNVHKRPIRSFVSFVLELHLFVFFFSAAQICVSFFETYFINFRRWNGEGDMLPSGSTNSIFFSFPLSFPRFFYCFIHQRSYFLPVAFLCSRREISLNICQPSFERILAD